MRRFAPGLLLAAVFLMLSAGCTTTSNAPATAPSTTATSPPATAESTTSSVAPSTTTTTLDRTAEIEAIFLDLERRRLQAILDQDEEAYRSVFANEFYEEESMVVFEMLEVIDPQLVSIRIEELFVDDAVCIAALVESDLTAAAIGGGVGSTEWVVELAEDEWGMSWAGSGWRCGGSHPLSP